MVEENNAYLMIKVVGSQFFYCFIQKGRISALVGIVNYIQTQRTACTSMLHVEHEMFIKPSNIESKTIDKKYISN